MTDTEKPDPADKQAHAYASMLERVKHGLGSTEEDVALRLHYVVDAAKEKAYELGELSREEAEKIGEYLKRDIQDAAEYLSQEGKQLGDWLKFDIELVEDRLADVLGETLEHAINPTNLELQQLAEKAAEENLWYTRGSAVQTASPHDLYMALSYTIRDHLIYSPYKTAVQQCR